MKLQGSLESILGNSLITGLQNRFKTNSNSRDGKKTSSRNPISYLHSLLTLLTTLEIPANRVLFDMKFVYKHHYYRNSVFFKAVLGRNPSSLDGVVAAGGRFDSLLSTLRGPVNVKMPTIGAVGVNFAFEKIVSRYVNFVKKAIGTANAKTASGLFSEADVLVCSLRGHVKDDQSQRLRVANELWKRNIRTECSHNLAESTDMHLGRAKKIGCSWLVVVPQKFQNQQILTAKNVDTKQDYELHFYELSSFLADKLKSERQEATSEPLDSHPSTPITMDSTPHTTHSLSLTDRGRRKNKSEKRGGKEREKEIGAGEDVKMGRAPVVHVIIPKKMQTHQKKLIERDVIQRLTPPLRALVSCSFPVVAVDLPIRVLQEVSTNLDTFSTIASRHGRYREELMVLKEQMRQSLCPTPNYSPVLFVYSISDQKFETFFVGKR
mmetsp:Transcript_23271/g.31787  ORF Transcript_23271/g.31787 Transcript_23271/m.31787 type:complete len:436 (-) Transcript_23271:41-1348(-)